MSTKNHRLHQTDSALCHRALIGRKKLQQHKQTPRWCERHHAGDSTVQGGNGSRPSEPLVCRRQIAGLSTSSGDTFTPVGSSRSQTAKREPPGDCSQPIWVSGRFAHQHFNTLIETV